MIDLSSIDKVPIAMVIGAKDAICTLKEAEKTKEILGNSVISFNSIAEYDHNSFAYFNDEKMMTAIRQALEAKVQETN